MNEILNAGSNNDALINLKVLRQAFGLASVLILVGVYGGYFVSQYFLLLPILVAGGLMFTSIRGWCPMIHILEQMPWNK